MHECVHVLVTPRMTTGMTYGLELSLGLFHPAIQGDTDCDRCKAIRAPENGRVAVLGWCHATVFEASGRLHLSPAIDVQPRQGLTLGCHDMHCQWLLDPLLQTSGRDHGRRVRGLHILDACETANGLEGVLTIMEDLGSIGYSFQTCQTR